MTKQWTPNKKTVELAPDAAARPSRIRRQPTGAGIEERVSLIGRIQWTSREWEIRIATAGIIFFALAISALVIDLGELLGY